MGGARAMPANEIFSAIEAKTQVKKRDVKAIITSMTGLIPAALKKDGKFTIPGIAMIKLKKKKATPAGKRMMFGKEVKIKARRKDLGEVLYGEGAEGRVLSTHFVVRCGRRCSARRLLVAASRAVARGCVRVSGRRGHLWIAGCRPLWGVGGFPQPVRAMGDDD